jgi:acyl carrier protein
MEPSVAPISPSVAPPADPGEKIRHLPEPARTAFQTFRANGDVAALDPLIFAILEHYAPRERTRPLAEYPGSALLVEDLGFDSLAITEVVFFTEELFEITIANEEILAVRSLDDLRAFIQTKVAARATR